MAQIQCLLAPNPGPWTGTGTNSWLIGGESLVLIDPGPDLPAHEAALLAAIAGRPVEALLVTHAHRDHSALARALARRLGAPIFAAADPHGGRDLGGEPPGEGVDTGFRPDHALVDGQELRLAGQTFRAIHTPGHLGGHFCFALGDLLFSGDHVMGWSSSVVTPPEGSMADYRGSLARLATEPWRRMLPGHGPEVTDPAARLSELIAHRALREAQILTALEAGAQVPAELAARIYPDLAPALRTAAERNVLAHLLELQEAGRVKPGAADRFALT